MFRERRGNSEYVEREREGERMGTNKRSRENREKGREGESGDREAG